MLCVHGSLAYFKSIGENYSKRLRGEDASKAMLFKQPPRNGRSQHHQLGQTIHRVMDDAVDFAPTKQREELDPARQHEVDGSVPAPSHVSSPEARQPIGGFEKARHGRDHASAEAALMKPIQGDESVPESSKASSPAIGGPAGHSQNHHMGPLTTHNTNGVAGEPAAMPQGGAAGHSQNQNFVPATHRNMNGAAGNSAAVPQRQAQGSMPEPSEPSSPVSEEAAVGYSQDQHLGPTAPHNTDGAAGDPAAMRQGQANRPMPEPSEPSSSVSGGAVETDYEDLAHTESTAEHAGNNICVNGKLLPNLYLLGAQKAGTTSLAGDLVASGVWNTKLDDEWQDSAGTSGAGNSGGSSDRKLKQNKRGGSKQGKSAQAKAKQGKSNDLRDNMDSIVSAAGSIAGHLWHAGFLGAKDLNKGTKQALAEDLVHQGAVGASAGQHLHNSTKKAVADDLVRNGLLNKINYEDLNDQTRAALDRDIVRACLLNKTVASHLSKKTREILAHDLEALDVLDKSKNNKAVLKGKQIEQTEFLLRNAAYLGKVGVAGIVDELKGKTKALLVGDLAQAGFLGSDIADHLAPDTKQSLGGDILDKNVLDSTNVQHLKASTKESIADDLADAGIMETGPVDTLNTTTRERIAEDIINKTDSASPAELEATKILTFTATKESHYFEHVVMHANYPEDANARMSKDWAKVRQSWKTEWLNKLVACPESETAPVYADFTPANMRMIPLPEGTRPTGRHWGSIGGPLFFKRRDGTSQVPQDLVMDLPQMMSEFYGNLKDKVAFVIMVREPLARMQSAYYHSAESDENGPCTECKGLTFSDSLEETLEDARIPASPTSNPSIRDWLWTSMYGRQLAYWLRSFKPSQFYILPMNVYSQGNNVRICQDLSDHVNVDIDCSPFENAVPEQLNTHEHPPLDEDTTPDLRDKFADFMAPENDQLIEVLAYAHQNGMKLASYDGKIGDKGDIKAWLEKFW